METVKILQVVGFKNSGKTTLVSRFIELAVRSGKRVSAIKHHGHGGRLEMPPAETDSTRFFEGGAASSLAFGDGVVQMHIQEQAGDLEKFIGFSLLANPDFIVIEGFKGAHFPKVVIVRTAEDWQELKQLSNVQLVIVHKGVKLADTETVEMDNQTAIDAFFTVWMEGELHESL